MDIPLGRDIYQCSSHIYGAVYGSQTPLAKALTLVIPQKLGKGGGTATSRCAMNHMQTKGLTIELLELLLQGGQPLCERRDVGHSGY